MGACRVHPVQKSDASESFCRFRFQPHALFRHWPLLKTRFRKTASRRKSAKTDFTVENGQESHVGHSSNAPFQETHFEGAWIDQLKGEYLRAGFVSVLQSRSRVLARASDCTARLQKNKPGTSRNVPDHSRPRIFALHDQAAPGPKSTFPGALTQQPKWARRDVRQSNFNNLGNLLAARLPSSPA